MNSSAASPAFHSSSPAPCDFAPSRTVSRMVAPSRKCGTCSRWPTISPRVRTTLPSSGVSAPASRASSVDFPAPFGPISPTRSPSSTAAEIPSKRGLDPNAFVNPVAVRRTPPIGGG